MQGERCEEVRSSYSTPLAWRERLLSPVSCYDRCGDNSSAWLEGACRCDGECVGGCDGECAGQTCCQDFSDLCHPDTGHAGHLWAHTVTWTVPLAAIVLPSCLLLLAVVIRLRTFKPHIEEGQEDVVRMIQEEEEEELDNKRPADMEEFIDFSLATACELDIGNNTQRYETKLSLSNRKITSL